MAATQEYSTNSGISALPEIDQRKYPEIYLDLLKLRNGVKVLQGALDSYTGTIGEEPDQWGNQPDPAWWHRLQNLTRTYALASEPLPAGSVVNFWDNAGNLGVRKANAGSGRTAHAFTTAAVDTATYGEFIHQGTCFSIGGLTIGVTYYLSNTAGLLSAGPGTVPQKVGYAIGTNILIFNPELV